MVLRKLIFISLIIATCSAAVTFYLSARRKKKEKVGGVVAFVRSPLSEKSAAVAQEAHYACRCHELKPYDICDVTTKLEADDVSIRTTDSESYTEDDEATGDVVVAMSPHKEKEKEPQEKPGEPLPK